MIFKINNIILQNKKKSVVIMKTQIKIQNSMYLKLLTNLRMSTHLFIAINHLFVFQSNFKNNQRFKTFHSR